VVGEARLAAQALESLLTSPKIGRDRSFDRSIAGNGNSHGIDGFCCIR
jgi:hypothetical protein